MNEFDTCLLELDFWPNNQKEKNTPRRPISFLQVANAKRMQTYYTSSIFFYIRMSEICIICPCRWPRTRVDCADMQEELGWVHWPLSKKQHTRGELRTHTVHNMNVIWTLMQLCYIHLFISSNRFSFSKCKKKKKWVKKIKYWLSL